MPLRQAFMRVCGNVLQFMDEPTSGLDPVVRDDILDLLLDFVQDEQNARPYLLPHHKRLGKKWADYIVFLHGGRVIFQKSEG